MASNLSSQILGVLSQQISKQTFHSLCQKLSIHCNKCHSSHNQSAPASNDSLLEKEKTVLEGKVIQKLDCQPPGNLNSVPMFTFLLFVINHFFLKMKTANANYMKLKRESMIKASQPTRIVKQLDHVVQTYKPVSDHKHNVSYSLFSPKKISIIYGRDFIVLNRDFLKSIFSTERI